MATATTATVLTNATDANFRSWGSWVSGLFTTFGWTLVTQTFATGTDWTTVTTPAAANTARVTEVWKMGDSLQATVPIFVTIDYGSAATLANPAIRIRCHTAAAQGGTLFLDTGATYVSVTANANSMTHFASGSSSRFNLMLGVSGTSWSSANQLSLNIERRKTSTGADGSNGFLIGVRSSGVQTSRGTTATGPHPITRASWDYPSVMTAPADGTFDGQTQVAPQIYLVGPIEFSINFVALPSGVAAVGATISVSIFGATHTYVVTQLTSPGTAITGGSSTVGAMRYE